MQVAPRNLVSRIEADPPPPTRVTHVAFSSDGTAMATLDVMDGLQVSIRALYARYTEQIVPLRRLAVKASLCAFGLGGLMKRLC